MSYPFKNVKRAAEIITIGKYIEKYQPGLLLDLNPITQRPPIFLAVDNTKSIEIVQTALMGVSLGIITIVENPEGSAFQWESLDGGHRKRALHGFYNGDFAVDGKFYNDLSNEEKSNFLNTQFVLDVYEPMNNYMKGEIFRILNGTMNPPNHQEILNSFGDTPIANAIRDTVRDTDEENHKLFNIAETKSAWIDVQNTRLKLEEFVARIYYRYYEDGFLGSRKDAQLMTMYSDENVKAKSLKKKVDAHLTFLLNCAKIRKTGLRMGKMGWKELNTLSNLYLYFNENLVKWTVFDYDKFYCNFYKVFSDYTVDSEKKYGDVVDFDFESADVSIKECFKNYTTCHDNKSKQEQLIKWIVEHSDMQLNLSVRVLDPQRLFSKDVKEAAFAKQGFVCGIDGKETKFDELEAAHDVAYILGGSTSDASNCVMIRKDYNRKMGTMTIAQYKDFLNMKVAA